ncbi:MAG: hypothetical protein ACTHJ4_00035 [Candidatus Nucleicultricaceae bacterium]
MNNKKKIPLHLIFTSALVLHYPLYASHTLVISEEDGERSLNSGERSLNSACPVQVSLSCRPKNMDDSEHKAEHLAPAVIGGEYQFGKAIDKTASEEKSTLSEDHNNCSSTSTRTIPRSEQQMPRPAVVDFEAAAKKTLLFFTEKLQISTPSSQGIRYSVQLANFLMSEESFQRKKEEKRRHGALIDNIVDILKELKEKSHDDAEIRAYWPRVIAAIAMNRRAHTPFFLPNIMTLITRPFPVDLINFIDQELESTKSYRVNAILGWMRRHRFVESNSEYNEAHPRWDISIASTKIRIVDGVWGYESYVGEEKTDNPQWRLNQTEILSYPYHMWTYIKSNARIVVNKHFPEETAELFVKRDTDTTTASLDVLQDVVVARYLNWLYKANWDGKKVSSFYHPSVEEQDGKMGILDDMRPHARMDNIWGEFPGMHAYEKMRMLGFKLPDVIAKHLAPHERADHNLIMMQNFLSSQANRYYTDAAAQGLIVASNYLRKRYLSFYCENILPIDLKCMTAARANETLYYLQFGRNNKVKEAHYDELYRISGCQKENVAPEVEKNLIVPPSPRKTPQSSRKITVRTQPLSTTAQQRLNLASNEVL